MSWLTVGLILAVAASSLASATLTTTLLASVLATTTSMSSASLAYTVSAPVLGWRVKFEGVNGGTFCIYVVDVKR